MTKYGIDSGNIWKFKDENIDNHFETLTKGNILEGDEFPALFMSCTTLKDPVSFNGRYHNFEVVTYVDYSSFEQFKGSENYQSDEYLVFKERIIQKFLNTVEKVIPTAKEHIVQAELGTPKTNEFYIQSTRGNVYGTEKTLNQVGPFSYKNKTEISSTSPYPVLIGYLVELSNAGGLNQSPDEIVAMKEARIYLENLRDGLTPKPLSSAAKTVLDYAIKETKSLSGFELKKLSDLGSGIKTKNY